MAKQIVRFLILLAIVILLIGAIYMTLSYQAYAIAGYFLIAAMLLILSRLSSGKSSDTQE